MNTAILVDGAFYRRRAYAAFGDVSPESRASELIDYCYRHLKWGKDNQTNELYRIFYYDCPPLNKQIYHPFLQRNIDLSKTDTYKWANEFYEALKTKRKVALRMGEVSSVTATYNLKKKVLLQLMRRLRSTEDLREDDFIFSAEQKGVDIKIGIDIASLAYKKQVNQIILISGDSDFVPAAKLARREGIDFILDPLYSNIKPSLFEHIDGLRTCDKAFQKINSSNE
jgi:uncharacterized LabA/DUF88 family protein